MHLTRTPPTPLASDPHTSQHPHTSNTRTHNWLPEGEILGLHIVLTLEEASTCYTRIRSRVDDAAEVRYSSNLSCY